MTAARVWNRGRRKSLITNQKTAVMFMQISGRDYQHNPPLLQEIASTKSPHPYTEPAARILQVFLQCRDSQAARSVADHDRRQGGVQRLSAESRYDFRAALHSIQPLRLSALCADVERTGSTPHQMQALPFLRYGCISMMEPALVGLDDELAEVPMRKNPPPATSGPAFCRTAPCPDLTKPLVKATVNWPVFVLMEADLKLERNRGCRHQICIVHRDACGRGAVDRRRTDTVPRRA